ncbi:hypothetical protein ACIBF1_27980 [Spirillospora sp. NPDC050679]
MGVAALRAGAAGLALLVLFTLSGIEPKFAYVVAAASAAALLLRLWRASGWRRARAALGLLAGVLALASLFLLLVLFSPADHKGVTAPPLVISVGLRADYRGTFACSGDCGDWSRSETLELTMPGPFHTRYGGGLGAAMGRQGWRETARVAGERGSVRLRLARTARQAHGGARIWPFRRTRSLALPDLLSGRSPLMTLPPAPDRPAALAGMVSGPDGGLTELGVTPDFTPESAVVLRFPRHAVLATTPAGSAADLARGRQERVVRVADLEEEAVQVDLLSPLVRSEPAARLVALGATGWAWLVLIAVAGLVVVPYVRGRGESLIPDLLARRRPAPPPHPRRRPDPRRPGRRGR